MKLELLVEKVEPSNGYTAVCYKVCDSQSGEVIYRTANRYMAEELVCSCNGTSEAVKMLNQKIDKMKAMRTTAQKRFSQAVLALRQIANSYASADFGRGVAKSCLANLGLNEAMQEKNKKN